MAAFGKLMALKHTLHDDRTHVFPSGQGLALWRRYLLVSELLQRCSLLTSAFVLMPRSLWKYVAVSYYVSARPRTLVRRAMPAPYTHSRHRLEPMGISRRRNPWALVSDCRNCLVLCVGFPRLDRFRCGHLALCRAELDCCSFLYLSS